MESDGFAYDGAAIYDQQARKYLRIYGDYPDERAHAEVAGREPTAETIIPADRFHVVSLDRGFRTLYAVWDDETHGYHVDADGVTEEFTSEWQAEAYRLELQGQAEQALLERAKGLISDFCRSEYGSEADFSDPAKIGVAYTTVTDDEIPVQVNIDLVNFRLERYLDDEHLETRQYGSLQELITNELENLDFSDLIHVSDEDVEQYRWHETEAPAVEHPEAVESVPVPQKNKFPYSVGDTVYLEDGKPFIIESIGLFDISLRDPSLRYPVSRAESRESFARLMERYPQPEQVPTYAEETVAVYPADKNNLPYDVEIRTLRFDEPESSRRYGWEAGSGMIEPSGEGEYGDYYRWVVGADACKNEEGDWYIEGTWTGGGGVRLPYIGRDWDSGQQTATTSQLVECWLLSAGESHEWRLPNMIYNRPSAELREALASLAPEQAVELEKGLRKVWDDPLHADMFPGGYDAKLSAD